MSINLCNSTYQKKEEAPKEDYSAIEVMLIVFGTYFSVIIFFGICLMPLFFCIRRYFINKKCYDHPPTYDQLVLSKQDLPKFKDETVIKLEEN